MKKSAYVIGGVLIGFVLATSTSAFADTVKSLIGKKVTGEYTVIVNGEKLSDKGAIIDGKANVPVRGISEALGADIKVSGKTINVTTEGNIPTSSSQPKPGAADNKYIGDSKASLEELKSSIINNRIKPTEEGRVVILADIQALKEGGAVESLQKKEDILREYDEVLAKATEELRLVNEALAAIK